VKTIIVLGGGTAGLIAALTIRRHLPDVSVRIIYSSDIGVIGVGEGTTPLFPRHIFSSLGLDASRLYAEAQPTWKLGIRFLWGPRPEFYYSFGQQFEARWSDLPKANGYYCNDECPPVDLPAALMAHGKVAVRRPDGWPQFHPAYAFHVENARLVEYLTERCKEVGVSFTQGMLEHAERGENGIAALHLAGGETAAADLYVDASGFRSELLGRFLEEPYLSFDDALFCDRAVIAGWPRSDEPILPYTTAETMDAGWCWQIEHENFINRGYVFSSRFLTEDDARLEFLRKNPKITTQPRVVKFRSGRSARAWAGNVVGIGNANGFVEPLEATAISVIVYAAQLLVDVLREGRPTAGLIATFNRLVSEVWTEIRDFLALHYRFNTRLATPFWRLCQNETPLRTAQPLVEFYEENGPSILGRHHLEHIDNIFALEGHWALLVGQRVPHRAKHEPAADEWARWRRSIAGLAAQAGAGLSLREALDLTRQPAWRWG
jgi:tryptophan halogenase